MKNNKNRKTMRNLSPYLLLLSTISLPTLSEETGVYLEAGIGTGGIDTEIAKDIPIPMSIESKGPQYFVKGGYAINEYMSFDLSAKKYGSVEFTSPLTTDKYTWSPKSLTLSTTLSYPITDSIAPFVSVGLGYITLDENSDAIKNDSGESFTYGVGIEFTPTSQYPVSIKAGYFAEVFSLESKTQNKDYDVTLDTFSLSLKYQF